MIVERRNGASMFDILSLNLKIDNKVNSTRHSINSTRAKERTFEELLLFLHCRSIPRTAAKEKSKKNVISK